MKWVSHHFFVHPPWNIFDFRSYLFPNANFQTILATNKTTFTDASDHQQKSMLFQYTAQHFTSLGGGALAIHVPAGNRNVCLPFFLYRTVHFTSLRGGRASQPRACRQHTPATEIYIVYSSNANPSATTASNRNIHNI